MTNKKPKKEKRQIPLRERGEVIQPNERPSQSLFRSVIEAEQQSSTTPTSLTGSTSLTGLTNPTQDETAIVNRQAVSPERDFTKTPNSVVRLIVAQGLFKGKSKQIYDYAWSVSRGAIKPQRTFRKTQSEIKKGSGIGSLNTIKDGIRHLEAIGLFKKLDSKIGEREGSEFEIFTPEELGYTSSTGLTSLTSLTKLAQNLVRPVNPETGLTDLTQMPVIIEENDSLRLSLKTLTEDDDFAEIRSKLNAAAREKTGRELTEKDYAALLDVFDLLITETEIAAARTNSISAYIPFMAENLRRRLHAKPKVEKKGSEVKKDIVGKTSVTSAPEPLDEESKTNLLKTYRQNLAEYGMEWVNQNESYFTAEDWQWLKSNLEAK